jgi:hypothetical protein
VVAPPTGDRQGGMDPRRGDPRFLVTSLKPEPWAARALYEDLYCARGEADICQA